MLVMISYGVRWLLADSNRRNEVMEAIVSIVAMTAVSSKEESIKKVRFWRSIDGRNCVGRFVPCLHERSADEMAKAEAEIV